VTYPANGYQWFGNTSDGYARGQEPRLGAIACWNGSSGYPNGHVAVVEKIEGNVVTVSESHYGGAPATWRLYSYSKGSGSYGGTGMALQGYIYIGDFSSFELEPVHGVSDAQFVGHQMTRGQKLTSKQYLLSQDRRFVLMMQSNGNLTLRNSEGALWQSGTAGHPGAYLAFQDDQNLVIYEPGRALWSSATNGTGADTFILQTDGNFVGYASGVAKYATYTATNRGGSLWPTSAENIGTGFYALIQGWGSTGNNILTNVNGVTRWQVRENTKSQVMFFERNAVNGTYTIRNLADNKVLDVGSASGELRAKVQFYSANNSSAQQWRINYLGDNLYLPYMFGAQCTNKVLDVTGHQGNFADGTLVWMWERNDTNSQKLRIVKVVPVTLDANSGKLTDTFRIVDTDSAIGDLPTPTRSGYTFVGWFTEATGGTQVTPTTKATANVTYYAHWTTSTTPTPVSITQHAGANRFETATKASQKAYPDPSAVDAVILSFADNFTDALAAAYLSGVVDAPILLSSTAALHPTTVAELNRLAPKTIYITGSTAVIGQGVEQTLAGLSFKPVIKRLGGTTRIQTAVDIATEAKTIEGTPRVAFVVYAGNYPDALSVGSLSAGLHIPILLTEKDTLSQEVRKFLEDNAVGDIIVIGGTPVVSDAVITQLKGLSSKPTVSRWSGTDRYATAKDVIDKATVKWGLRPTVIGIASGDNFPDALVGGASIGNKGGVLVISSPDKLSAATQTLITAHRDRLVDIEIFGSTAAIRVKEKVQTLLENSADWNAAYARVLDGYKKAVDEKLFFTGDSLIDIGTRAAPTSNMNAYALRDITNDGIPELIIGNNSNYDPKADGIVRIFTLRNGPVEIYHDNSGSINLLKNDRLLGLESVGANGVYTYHKAEPDGAVWQAELFNGAINGRPVTSGWYRAPYERADYLSYIELTAQEARDIQASYGDPIAINWRPVTSWRTAS
jgi:uncharacterized repeat protein (TIGR02543 family)